MATFLEQLAEALLQEHDRDLRDVAVVLPSQRAGLYLRQALARLYGRALWSPEVFTLPSFMERISGLRALPMEELLFEAYEAYKLVAAPDIRPLDDFLEWAPVTLADMSEADANMVRLDGFYRDLRSWEEIDWSFNSDPLSDGQQRMVRYWALAGKLHASLNERLLVRRAGSSGLVERTAAERGVAGSEWTRIWFAGLNAFTAAEQRVLDSARDLGLARFAWDADSYYLDAPGQEAGEHLRSAIRRYGPGALPIGNALREAGPYVSVVEAPDPVTQAWCAADHLRSSSPQQLQRTAIILANEALLPALLEALPAGIGPVNVTMGLSLATLPIGSLLEAFVQMQGTANGTGTWSTDAVVHLLRHALLRDPSDPGRMEEAIAAIVAVRLPRLDPRTVQGVLASANEMAARFSTSVFSEPDKGAVHARLMALLAWAKAAAEGDAFTTEQVYQASVVVGRVARLLESYGHGSSGSAWASVMLRVLRSSRIALFGEPLTGLQVMGLLEARGLDVQNVILLGAQEGMLPQASIERSYIPFELRRAHGLPLRESSDAVQAYNFLRLVQRAQQVLLVHDAQGSANGPSRFIEQFRHELFSDRPGRMVEFTARAPVRIVHPSALVVPKDAGTMTRLHELVQNGLSPTVLSAWLRCPLDFWFRYVGRLREPEVAGARIGGDVLGNALHGLLEDIHRPWLGRLMDADEVEDALRGVRQSLRTRLATEVGADRLGRGQPLLQMDMATRAAENFLRDEARAVRNGMRMAPIALETELRTELLVAGIPGHSRPVIKGRVDRVDERDGIVHILDLKTGRVDGSALRIKEIALPEIAKGKGHAMQLLVYAWLYLTLHPQVNEVRTGLQPMQRVSGSGGLYLRVGEKDVVSRTDLPAIAELLGGMVRGMLDPAGSFQHDPESAYCPFCASTE